MNQELREGYLSYTPAEAKELLAADNVQIVDVRETWEFQIGKIEGSVNIPLSILPLKFNELVKNAVTLVVCHHGSRSFFACRLLEKEGFRTVINLTGGIDAWSRTVDPGIPTY